MLWNLDGGSLFIAVGMVSMVGFMLGMVLDGLMGRDGFGPVGNMVVLTAGFFGSVYGANMLGYNLKDATMAIGTGMVGAMLAVVALAGLKAGFARFMSS